MANEVRHLVSMNIHPVQGGKFQTTLKLDNGQMATSKPFDSTDSASHWAARYAEEAGKASDEDFSPEVKAGLHSEAMQSEPEA